MRRYFFAFLVVMGAIALLYVINLVAEHKHGEEVQSVEPVKVLWTVISDDSSIDQFMERFDRENRCIGEKAMAMMNCYTDGKKLRETTSGKTYALIGIRADSVEPQARTITNILAKAEAHGFKEAPPEVAFLLRKKSQEDLGSERIALTTPYLRRSLYFQPWEAGAFTLEKKIVDNEERDCLDVHYYSNDANWGNDWIFVFLAPEGYDPKLSGYIPPTPSAN